MGEPTLASAPRIAFVTLGCKVNQAESEAIARSLGIEGTGVSSAEADLVVINTCTVTGEADRKARKAVRHALGMPVSPVVVVTGCLAALDAAALAAIDPRVVVEPDKQRVASSVRAALEARLGSAASFSASHGSASRARMQLKVEDGCDSYCTYCIVPFARGVPRVVPIDEVVAEAGRMVRGGASEIVLTGINIGRYDDGGQGLPELLRAVAATGVSRVRLSSVEPRDVTDALLAAAAETSAFCAHLHVPLQSGSDPTLARMGRPYTGAAYAETIARARRAFPGIAISTDVIAGFPGETEEDHAQTLAFVEAEAFSRMHVFRYSARPGTPAATLPHHVPPEVKARRSAELRTLAEKMAARYAAAHAGTVRELLVERTVRTPGGELRAQGVTREYLRVSAPLDGAHGIEPAPGMTCRVLMGVVGDDGVIGARIVG